MNTIQPSFYTNGFSASWTTKPNPHPHMDSWQRPNGGSAMPAMGQLAGLITQLLSALQNTPKPANTPMNSMQSAMANRDPDAPNPVITLMSFYKTVESELGLDETQKAKINDWASVAKPKREALEKEYAGIRKELRTAMLNGEDEATTTKLTDAMQGKEREVLLLKAECARLIKSTLTPEQYSDLMQRYSQGTNTALANVDVDFHTKY